MRQAVLLIAILCLVGCTQREPLPWRLIELGQGSLTEAQAHRQWILVESELGQHWWAPDTAMDSRTAMRDLRSLPDIDCGDRMRLDPRDLPVSVQQALGWEHCSDSLTVHWQCFGPPDLADHFWTAQRRHPFDQPALEAEWMDLLRARDPDLFEHLGQPLQSGDTVRLVISTERPDGTRIEPDPVHLAFALGDDDQVVPALESELEHWTDNSRLALWSRSTDAFGASAHPDLGLPAHTPVRFLVRSAGADQPGKSASN